MAQLRCLIGWAFFCLTMGSSAPAWAFSEERLEKIAESHHWHSLLHYQNKLFGGARSKAISDTFFMSPKGRTSPLMELKADLAEFSKSADSVKDTAEHPQCKFPERYSFLKRELALDIQNVNCATFLKWKAGMRGERVSLLFASAFMSSPASVAGHSFLKLGAKSEQAEDAISILHDQVIVFSAVTGESSGIGYILRGIFGGFYGEFSLSPYYNTVHTYQNFEQRDLWEYELALTAEQIDRLLNHLWEMNRTLFGYYFFDENCSYQLMALLEVANPEWHLLDRFHFIVNPSDTIRALADQPNAIRKVSYRPSFYRQLLQRYRQLPGDEQQIFRERFADREQRLTGQESVPLLDAAIDFSIYSNMQEKRRAGEKPGKRFLPGANSMPPAYYKLLQARAKAAASLSSSAPVVPSPGRPDLGHPISRVAFDFGFRQNQRFVGVSLRYAYHDLLNPDHGYLKNSQIEFLRIDLHEIFPEHKFRLREFKLVDAVSLEPLNSINHQASWSFSMGAYSPIDIDCKNGNAAQLSLGAGVSSTLFADQDRPLFFLIPRVFVEYSGWFKDNFRFGPSVIGGVIANSGDWGKAMLTEEVFYFPTQTNHTFYHRLSARMAAMLSSRYELRVSTSRYFTTIGAYFDSQIAVGFYL